MRIESIKLFNYRQFKELDINFKKQKENDLHLLIGKNGTGKTNLLNAINWCLYGDEPHLSKNSELLPILNLNSIDEADPDKDIKVYVEVQFNTGDSKSLVFNRNYVFRKYENEKYPVRQKTEFEARIVDEKGNSELLNEEDAIASVERSVPNRIRDFFFFDGERLDNYFRRATAQNIRNAIFVISQIELLENKIERKLEETLKELRRDAGKTNPKIEETRNKLEEEKERLEDIKTKIEESNEEISTAKEKIRECEAKLHGIPDLEDLQQEKLELKSSKKHFKEIRDKKILEKQDELFEFAKIIMVNPVIGKAINIIEEKRRNKEIPPPADVSLLEEILKNKVCSICGIPLNSKSETHVKNLLKKLELSSFIATQLSNIENPLRLYRDKIKQFKEQMNAITQEIITNEKELEKIEKRIDKIEKNLIGYDPEKIKEWVEQQRIYEGLLADHQRQLGFLLGKKKEVQEKVDELEKKFDEETKKENKAIELTTQIDFCRKALNIVTKTKELIMHETREKIQSETKKLFFDLIWKKQTFKDIFISEDYDIDLIHFMGYPCLGSISAAERELLALSFTLALHKISGFDSPILIDTPVARVSDEHRENLGNIFVNISKDKQLILLFTPAEYSPEISKFSDNRASNKYHLKLSSDEKEIKLEVI
jgi:DNA sulfur modification protein DndD